MHRIDNVSVVPFHHSDGVVSASSAAPIWLLSSSHAPDWGIFVAAELPPVAGVPTGAANRERRLIDLSPLATQSSSSAVFDVHPDRSLVAVASVVRVDDASYVVRVACWRLSSSEGPPSVVVDAPVVGSDASIGVAAAVRWCATQKAVLWMTSKGYYGVVTFASLDDGTLQPHAAISESQVLPHHSTEGSTVEVLDSQSIGGTDDSVFLVTCAHGIVPITVAGTPEVPVARVGSPLVTPPVTDESTKSCVAPAVLLADDADHFVVVAVYPRELHAVRVSMTSRATDGDPWSHEEIGLVSLSSIEPRADSIWTAKRTVRCNRGCVPSPQSASPPLLASNTASLGIWMRLQDQCMRAHKIEVSWQSNLFEVRSNQLVAELSPATEGEDIIWGDVFECRVDQVDDVPPCELVVVARGQGGFYGVEELVAACNTTTADHNAAPQNDEDHAVQPTQVTANVNAEPERAAVSIENDEDIIEKRQDSEDTVQVGEIDDQQAHDGAEGGTSSSALQRESDALPATATIEESHAEPVPQSSMASLPQSAPSSSAVEKGHSSPQESVDAANGSHPAKNMVGPRKAPSPTAPIRRYKAASPEVETPQRKPPVPRTVTPRINDRSTVQVSSKHELSSGIAAEAPPASPAPRKRDDASGPGVEVQLDTDDLAEQKDSMHVYILTKLLGESIDVPVWFMPLPHRYTLSDLRRTLEDHHQGRRLSICFATPMGKLVELRPSTFKIFQSYEDEVKQIYCRGLYPLLPGGPSSPHTSLSTSSSTAAAPLDGERRAHSAMAGIQDISAITSATGRSLNASLQEPVRHRRLTPLEEKSVSSRLHETAMESHRRTLLVLEQRFWPSTTEATPLPKAVETTMIERLYKQSQATRAKKLESLRQEVDAKVFGAKAHVKLPESQRKELAEKFYTTGMQSMKQRVEAGDKQALPKPKCKQLSTVEEWEAWQSSMARGIKSKFKIKDPYSTV